MASKKPVAESKDFDGMTLMRMRIEGIKRIRLVDISINQTITTISSAGLNAQGKSSLLDGYVMCMRGKTALRMDPIHHGRQEGSALCDFGDGQEVKLSVKRTIKRVGESDFTTDLELNIPGHVPPSRVEEFLRDLTGSMSFDPMALDRMNDEERYEAIKKLVAGFDFAANTQERNDAESKRRDINRDQKREQAAADSIDIDLNAPAEHIDEAALTAELRSAGDTNLDTQERAANRERAKALITSLRQIVDSESRLIDERRTALTAIRDKSVSGLRAQIAALEQRIVDVESDFTHDMTEDAKQIERESADAKRQADELVDKLENADPLPEIIDTRKLAVQLDDARKSNRLLADWEGQRARRLAHSREADKLAAESQDLTAKITELDQARVKAIESAQLPVSTLGFGDGYITLGGVPWVDASTAERIDASTAIAMALSPKLKVILIRHGSDLGAAMRERIRQRAAEKGFRCLMEVVDDSGSTSITLQDGEVLAKRA